MSRLAFDTATAACSVALSRGDGALFERLPESGRMFEQPAHTTELLPAIVGLLAEAEIGWDDIEAVAIGIGPGAFTGLRIGIATARAIATARGLPLIPVSSLAALAERAGRDEPHRAVIPVLDARRGEFYFGHYRGGPAQETLAADAVAPPSDLVAAAAALVDQGEAPIAVGEGAIKLADQLRAVGVEVTPGHDQRHVIHGGSLLELADTLEAIPANQVTPNYIRPPDAKVSSRSEPWLGGNPQ